MKQYVLGNFMDWGNVLDKLNHLQSTNTLDDHQDELIGLLRFDGNWRLREAAVEAAAGLTKPKLETVRQLLQLIKREDIYYDVRIMATESLSRLLPVMMESKELYNDLTHPFINEISLEVTDLLSSPEPPIFHDALNITFKKIQELMATA
jgi:hypothetical protein